MGYYLSKLKFFLPVSRQVNNFEKPLPKLYKIIERNVENDNAEHIGQKQKLKCEEKWFDANEDFEEKEDELSTMTVDEVEQMSEFLEKEKQVLQNKITKLKEIKEQANGFCHEENTKFISLDSKIISLEEALNKVEQMLKCLEKQKHIFQNKVRKIRELQEQARFSHEENTKLISLKSDIISLEEEVFLATVNVMQMLKLLEEEQQNLENKLAKLHEIHEQADALSDEENTQLILLHSEIMWLSSEVCLASNEVERKTKLLEEHTEILENKKAKLKEIKEEVNEFYHEKNTKLISLESDLMSLEEEAWE